MNQGHKPSENGLENKWQFYEVERDFHDALASSFQLPDTVRIEDWESPLWNHIEELHGEIRGKTVLDVGCGFGREAVLFALKGALVTGIDLSEQSISKARDFAQHIGVSVNFLVGNVDLLNYNEQFDIVFCRAILHHLPYPAETTKRLSCCIKPGGLLIAQEPKLENPIVQIGRRFFNPSTVTERPFRQGELESIFNGVFDEVGVRYFFILSPLCFAFNKVKLLRSAKLQHLSFRFLNKIDQALLAIPLLEKKYSWIEIIHAKANEEIRSGEDPGYNYSGMNRTLHRWT